MLCWHVLHGCGNRGPICMYGLRSWVLHYEHILMHPLRSGDIFPIGILERQLHPLLSGDILYSTGSVFKCQLHQMWGRHLF